MSTTSKIANDNYREKIVDFLIDTFKKEGEDVLRIKSNTIAFPFVNSEGEGEWLRIVVSIPKGSKKDEDFDAFCGWTLAEEYEKSKKEKADKVAKAKDAAKKNKEFKEKVLAEKQKIADKVRG